MRDAISFIHGKNDIESIVDVLKLWFSASNFTNKVIQADGKIEFRIQHNLGRKGFLYIGTLISSLFGDLNIKSKEVLRQKSTLW